MKRFYYTALCILISVSLLTSCGLGKDKTNKEQNSNVKIGDTGGLKMPLTTDNAEIRWFVTSGENDLNSSYVIRKIREITGVNLQLEVTSNSMASDKIKVLIASKKMPDIIGKGVSESEASDLAMQGALASVEDYMDKLPNFKKTFVDNKDNSWIFKSYQAPDGKLYGFFGYDWNREVNTQATMYRKDIFDKHNIPMWDSTEGFYTTLKKLKELYPSSNPYALKTQDQIFDDLSHSWGIRAQRPYYNEEEKVWKYGDTDPAYKDMLDFLKKLYNEKLIDPEFLTATQADWTSKMTQRDKAFVTTDWIGRMEMFKKQTADTVPEYDLRFANPVGPKQTMPTLSQVCWARYVSKSDKSELAFKLLDFILSPAGAELITMGVIDETYVLDENGKAKYLEFPDKNPTINELEAKYGMFIEGMYLKFDRRSSYFNFTEREQEAQDFAKNSKNMEPMDPILSFTAEEREEINEYNSALIQAGKEFSMIYVLNNGGENEWNAWKTKAEGLGSEKLIQIYNKAQERYDSK